MNSILEEIKANPKKGVTVTPEGNIRVAIPQRSGRTWNFMHGGWMPRKQGGSWDFRGC